MGVVWSPGMTAGEHGLAVSIDGAENAENAATGCGGYATVDRGGGTGYTRESAD